MAELDADRALALTYVPTRKRAAIEALWRLDAALGAVLAGGREPLISEIKLAWWRDSLERLDTAKAPAEPVLEAAARHILPSGVRGTQLSALEEGWTALLSPDPLTPEELTSYAAGRGALLFRLSGLLIGQEPSGAMLRGGEAWALVDLARHSNAADAAAAIEAARAFGGERIRWPSALRPLGMLAALARRDLQSAAGEFEPQGAPGRMLTMLRHRFTGT